MAIFTLFLLGQLWILLIPIIIIIKSIFVFSNINVKKDILNVNSPAMVFQKIKIKNTISFDLLASPLFTIGMGIILKGL